MKIVVPEALKYLRTQRVGVLAVEMLDGAPHGAAIHFAHSEDPLVFYYLTGRDTRKIEALSESEERAASFVVGSDENDMKTLQFDGTARLVRAKELPDFDSVYLGKFPENSRDEKSALVRFTPTWWRFTDWNTSEGKKIWSSE